MPSLRAEPASSQMAENLASPASSLSAAWDYARQLFCLTLFFVTSLLFSPVCWLLASFFGEKISPASGQRLIRGLFDWWLRICVRLGAFDIQFSGLRKLRHLRGAIVTPNHPSLLDALLLFSALPGAVCIMRAGLMRSPFLAGLARIAGFIPNDSGPALIHQGIDRIHRGENLLIFPEGTRTCCEQAVNPFKSGFALIATRSGAPIQPVFIEREGRYLGKGAPLFTPIPLPVRYRIHLGETITPRKDESAQQLSARLENYFRDHLENTGQDIRLKIPVP